MEVNPDVTDGELREPCLIQATKTIQALPKHGAFVDAVDDIGNTPLHWTASKD